MGWADLSHLVRYDVHAGEAETTVRLAGELDLASTPQLVGLIEQTAGAFPRVVLDLSRVGFLDAHGLSQLLTVDRRLRDLGGGLVVRRPHRAVRRLLRLSGSEAALRVEEAAACLDPTDDVAAICADAVEAAIRIGRATTGNAQLADATGALRIVAERGFSRDFLDFFEVVDDSESACGTARERGDAVYVPDVTRSPIFLGAPSLDAMRDAGSRSVGSIPLRGLQGQVVGMLSVHGHRRGSWTREQQRELRALADATGRLLAARAS